MMEFTKKSSARLKESYLSAKLDSGMKIIVIPKDLPTVTAMVCCDFGAVDIEYECNGETYSLPYGTAHFLEHKMFENPDGSDAFSEFDAFGGNANAFTSYENTCYYFSCTDNFYENLEILLRAVSNLSVTEESVDKERKIITREILMYEDIPTSVAARNLCKALYHNHPTIYPIAGTVDSVSEITKDVLERAYRDFYTPENLTLCVCGNADPEKIAEIADRFFNNKGTPRPKTVFREEPKEIKEERVEEESAVATPIFSIGIKCAPPKSNDLASFRHAAAARIAISLTFGRASDFYCESYSKGLLSERFYAGFTQSRSASHVIITGSSNSPDEVKTQALRELEHRKNAFFTEEQILREKRAAFAESLTLFDSGEDMTASFATGASLDYDEYDCIDVLSEVTPDEIRGFLESLDLSNCSISIISGKEEPIC